MRDDLLITAPVDLPPAPAGHPTVEQRRDLLAWVLRGVDLGTYDRQILGWAVWTLDVPTVLVLASLIERARRAEYRALQARVNTKLRPIVAAMDDTRTDTERLARWQQLTDDLSLAAVQLLDLANDSGAMTAVVAPDALERLAAEREDGDPR